MKKNKKIDPGRLAELKKKREELKRQEEQMRMQMPLCVRVDVASR